jgi:hypothetical protein
MTDREARPAETGETRISLPPSVDGDFQVFVNGVLQEPGVGFERLGRTLVFPRALVPEVKMSKLKWVLVSFGITAGNQKHDSVDIAYTHQGRRLVATGLLTQTPAP